MSEAPKPILSSLLDDEVQLELMDKFWNDSSLDSIQSEWPRPHYALLVLLVDGSPLPLANLAQAIVNKIMEFMPQGEGEEKAVTVYESVRGFSMEVITNSINVVTEYLSTLLSIL
jgi:hypothetical protein